MKSREWNGIVVKSSRLFSQQRIYSIGRGNYTIVIDKVTQSSRNGDDDGGEKAQVRA